MYTFVPLLLPVLETYVKLKSLELPTAAPLHFVHFILYQNFCL